MEVDAGLAIGRLIQIAYSTDKKTTLNLLGSGGRAKLSVDSSGNARLSGIAGVVRFNGAPALESYGFSSGIVSVTLSHAGGNRIRLSGGIRAGVGFMKVSGSFDLMALMTGCSGLVCEAARILRGRSTAMEQQLRRAMGR